MMMVLLSTLAAMGRSCWGRGLHGQKEGFILPGFRHQHPILSSVLTSFFSPLDDIIQSHGFKYLPHLT